MPPGKLPSSGGFETESRHESGMEVDRPERLRTYEALWQAGGLRFWYDIPQTC